jgi:hypothetical protein
VTFVPSFLVTEELAAVWTGRPASTIRRWATEGRITRHGRGRGNVRFDLAELNAKTEDENGNVIPGKAPAVPPAHAHAA